MIETESQHRIQEIFRRGSRSFLQYINEARPWSNQGDKPLVAGLHRLADEELNALAALARWMDDQRIAVPFLGAFSTQFTSYNFISIRLLLKEAIPRQHADFVRLELDARNMTGEAQKRVLHLAEMTGKHLAEMIALVA